MENFFYGIKNLLWPRLAILCYHRIQNYTTDPVKITVSKNNFLKHIDFLKGYANIISPDQLFDALINKVNLPRRSILLTFDDGYASYKDTMSLLQKELIPAIFFISLRGKKYWWDILSELLLNNQVIKNPEYDKINNLLSELGHNFKIEKYIDSSLVDNLKNWDVTVRKFPFNRNRAYYLLAKKMEDTNHYENDKLVNKISSLSNEKRDFSYLNENHLVEFHKIGCHTVNHYNLSKLSYGYQKKEIEICKNDLNAKLGQKIEVFAYPFGGKIHYNSDTLKIVKNNFNFAFSNFEGLVHKDTNSYEIPRFLVRDWEIDKFTMKVKSFFQ